MEVQKRSNVEGSGGMRLEKKLDVGGRGGKLFNVSRKKGSSEVRKNSGPPPMVILNGLFLDTKLFIFKRD